jgi:hypothetical protein
LPPPERGFRAMGGTGLEPVTPACRLEQAASAIYTRFDRFRAMPVFKRIQPFTWAQPGDGWKGVRARFLSRPLAANTCSRIISLPFFAA